MFKFLCREVSIDGVRYFCTFTDDFLHYSRAYFLRDKRKVKDRLKRILSLVTISGRNNVKILLTDGGKEYDNEEVRVILNAAGIDQRKPATYTPQQNGHLHIGTECFVHTHKQKHRKWNRRSA